MWQMDVNLQGRKGLKGCLQIADLCQSPPADTLVLIGGWRSLQRRRCGGVDTAVKVDPVDIAVMLGDDGNTTLKGPPVRVGGMVVTNAYRFIVVFLFCCLCIGIFRWDERGSSSSRQPPVRRGCIRPVWPQDIRTVPLIPGGRRGGVPAAMQPCGSRCRTRNRPSLPVLHATATLARNLPHARRRSVRKGCAPPAIHGQTQGGVRDPSQTRSPKRKEPFSPASSAHPRMASSGPPPQQSTDPRAMTRSAPSGRRAVAASPQANSRRSERFASAAAAVAVRQASSPDVDAISGTAVCLCKQDECRPVAGPGIDDEALFSDACSPSCFKDGVVCHRVHVPQTALCDMN